LEQLTENGVPNEILATMRHSDDVHELEQERAGYVPDDDDAGSAEEEVYSGRGPREFA